jgi:hypothetical protein
MQKLTKEQLIKIFGTDNFTEINEIFDEKSYKELKDMVKDFINLKDLDVEKIKNKKKYQKYKNTCKIYYLKNRENKIKYQKEYDLKNREKILERKRIYARRKYYENKLEKINNIKV